MNNYTDLEKSILKTISYFDIFQYPLTSLEIYKWLFEPEKNYSLSEVISALDSLVERNILEKKFGFYFLPQKSNDIITRLNRYYLAEKKYKIALSVIGKIKWLKYIRAIMICNNVGYNNAQAESDIDFFIITKKKRIWFSRILITLFVSIIMRRRHAKEIANRACLSFYLAEDHFNIEDISVKPLDIYLVFWLATLAPVLNQEVYENFLAANSWHQNFLPNFYPASMSIRRKEKINSVLNKEKYNFVGEIMEKLSARVQRFKMKGHYNPNHTGTEVITNDSMLKFHENDRRQQYLKDWQARLKNLNLV